MTDRNQTATFYTVVYDVRGDRQKHDEWWRMIHRLPDGISVKASASFDALAKLDELEGGMASNEQQNQAAPTCGQPKGIERHHTLRLDADDALLLWGILDMQPGKRGWVRFDRIVRDLAFVVAEDDAEKAK